MVMKFEIFMKNHDFDENSVESKFSHEIDFLRVQDPENPLGSCAARNVQNFGYMACRDGFVTYTTVFKQYFSSTGGNLEILGLVTIRSFGSVFLELLAILSFIFNFLLSSITV